METLVKLAIIYGIFLALSIVKDLTSSGFDGDFELYGKDKNGKTRIGHFTARKTMPYQLPKNLISYSHSTNGLQSLSYGRHVLKLGTWHLYGTVGIAAKPDELIASLGVTLTF